MYGKKLIYAIATALHLVGCTTHPAQTPSTYNAHSTGQSRPKELSELELKVEDLRNLIMGLRPQTGLVDENVGPYKKTATVMYENRLLIDIRVSHEGILEITHISDGKFRNWTIPNGVSKPSMYQLGKELQDPRIGDRALEIELIGILSELRSIKERQDKEVVPQR